MAEEGANAARAEHRAGIDATPPAARRISVETLAVPIVFIIAGVTFFFHLGAFGFWEPDEARYGEIAREMLALRDYIVPHLNYVAYVEKPPLLYWVTAVSFRIFGINEFAARLIPAISAMLGLLAASAPRCSSPSPRR